MQGTSSWLWRFNLLLLRLLGEISFSYFFTQFLGFSFGFGPASSFGRLRASVLCSDRMGLKEQLIRGLWLTQAVERERYGVRGEPAAEEAGVTLHQPEVCCVFSRGSCLWIMCPWQWWAAQAPRRGGVDSDLCSHTGFLVALATALASHARLWCLRW